MSSGVSFMIAVGSKLATHLYQERRQAAAAIMSGFDANLVHAVPILGERPLGTSLESASDTERMLLDFLLQYRVGGQFIYR